MCADHPHDASILMVTAVTAVTAVTDVTEAPAQDDAAVCPVMAGTPVSTAAAEANGLFRDYAGNRYWFCCAACGPLFDADPTSYVAAGALPA